MDSIVLLSKISPPKTHPVYIDRPELDQKLTDAAERCPSVSLIIAPPGYGKTSLAAAWVSGRDFSAWLTIGKTDIVFISFIRHLSAAIKLSAPEFGKLLSGIFVSPINRSPEYIAEITAYEIEKLEKPISVIIDNYQEVEDKNIADFMTALLDNMPFNLHLVIMSQEDPPFSVSERRLRENINEIRQSDLTFKYDDIKYFFNNSFGIYLPEEYMKKVEIKTEGWPAAVSLSAMSLSKIEAKEQQNAIDTAFASYNYIIDYFSDAIIAGFDKTTLDFIADTVLLDSFTPVLADFARQSMDSESVILKLKHKHLPVLIQENDHQWYRYHTLFSDYIKSKYKNPNRTAICIRASEWFEQNKSINFALKYAFQSEDVSRIESLVLSESETLFLTGKFEIINRLFKDWENRLLNTPVIIKVKLWSDYLVHNYDDLETFNDYISTYIGSLHSEASGSLLCLKAWVLFENKDPSCEEYAEQSSLLLKDENSFYAYMAKLIHGKSLLLNGKAQKAAEELLSVSGSLKNTEFTFMYYAVINNLMYAFLATGNPEAAGNAGKEALYLTPSDEVFKPEKSMILIAMARICCEKKDLEQAEEYIEKAHFSNHLIKSAGLVFEELSELHDDIKKLRALKNFKTDNLPSELLSSREKDVLILVSKGHSNQEISSRLYISIGTVKWHLNNMFSKLNVKNRTQAILKAEQLNLL